MSKLQYLKSRDHPSDNSRRILNINCQKHWTEKAVFHHHRQKFPTAVKVGSETARACREHTRFLGSLGGMTNPSCRRTAGNRTLGTSARVIVPETTIPSMKNCLRANSRPPGVVKCRNHISRADTCDMKPNCDRETAWLVHLNEVLLDLFIWDASCNVIHHLKGFPFNEFGYRTITG